MYMDNKQRYIDLPRYWNHMGGNDEFDWNDIEIINELGTGYNATAYRIRILGSLNHYALKRQKISTKEYESTLSDNYPINTELKFFHWINGLPERDKIFFMSMHHYRRYECEFDFKPIKGVPSDDMAKSPYCQDTVVDLKGPGLHQLIDKMSRDQILSIFAQTLYGITLMNENGYYHTDARTENICVIETDIRYLDIKLDKLYQIKTMGNLASLIDYGNVVDENQINQSDNEEMKKMMHRYKTTHTDTWYLIESILLNNLYVFDQIEKGKTGFRSKELYNMIKIVSNDSQEIYQDVLRRLMDRDGEDLDQMISDGLKPAQTQWFKTLGFDFIRHLWVYHGKIFKQVLKQYFNLKKKVRLSDQIPGKIVRKIVDNISEPHVIISMIIGII
jgi:serine/threonine protein kinase